MSSVTSFMNDKISAQLQKKSFRNRINIKIENKTNNLMNSNEIERPALKGAITHKIDR